MSAKQPKFPKNTTDQLENKPVVEPVTKQEANKKISTKPPVTKSGNTTKTKEAIKVPVKEVQTSVKKTKTVKEKVIRDSFSFPEHDYLKISELKQTCLAEGIHVKKSELLRAGLHLLTQLSLTELKQTVGQVEKIKTGRPNS